MSGVIAVTTAALCDLLRRRLMQTGSELADLVVTTQTPDRAHGGDSMTRLNLFLFDAPVDRAFRERSPAAARGDAANGVLGKD